MEKDKRGPGFLSGFILGGIIGAIIVYVLSLKGGREALKAKMKDIMTQARETIHEAIEEGREAAMRKEAEFRGEEERK
jgi:gas vesicle protein